MLLPELGLVALDECVCVEGGGCFVLSEHWVAWICRVLDEYQVIRRNMEKSEVKIVPVLRRPQHSANWLTCSQRAQVLLQSLRCGPEEGSSTYLSHVPPTDRPRHLELLLTHLPRSQLRVYPCLFPCMLFYGHCAGARHTPLLLEGVYEGRDHDHS